MTRTSILPNLRFTRSMAAKQNARLETSPAIRRHSLKQPLTGPTTVHTEYSAMPERIPPPPPTQALNTTTFAPPPLDLSLTLAELIDFHRTHSPNHVVYVYEDAPGERKQIIFSTWIRAIHRAGRHVRDLFQLPEPQVGSAKPVISMLANSGENTSSFCPTFPR